jgi:hypothetical protein
MVMFFIVVGGFIVQCVGGIGIKPDCGVVSPLVFGGLAVAGTLELVYELKGIISIFSRKEPRDKDE